MKVVYLYPQFAQLAGTERVLIDKMNYLAECYGYDVVMLTTEQGIHPLAFRLSEKVLHVDLDIRYCDLYKINRFWRVFKTKRYDVLFQKRFDSFIEEYRPDIVVTTTYNSRYLSVVNNCHVPFRRVLESHIDKKHLYHNDPSNRTNILKFINAYLGMKATEREARKFDILIALSDEDAIDWGKFLRTEVIINVVNLNSTNSYSNHDNKQIMFVGRYNIQKGLPELFAIWDIVCMRHSDWHLNLYGTGELKEFVLQKAMCLKKNIHHHEPDRHIHDRYIENSILVVPSLYEPFGLVVIEAMSCGLPVVAFSDLVGPKRIIENQLDGFLVPNRDIRDFAEKICLLIESKELRKKMGKNAIEKSFLYSPSNVMPRWNELFIKLCNS